MGFFKTKNQRMLDEVLKDVKKVRTMITCPRCRNRTTVVFLGPNDSYKCKCGYITYANELKNVW